VRIEDAGFEIRDMIAWVYGSGFPKSHNGEWGGTALKPALEPITVARKPLVGTVEANWREHGTGAMNIDGCRVEPTGESRERVGEASQDRRYTEAGGTNFAAKPGARGGDAAGRWPANLIHDGSDEPTGLLGDAARFFYCAKASKRDRNEGLEGFALGNNMRVNGPRESEEAKHATLRANIHPTVKPTDLMRYLCRLVTPPGGVVLDPFMGSGSTGKAAVLEGFRFIGCEMNEDYIKIARARIHAASLGNSLKGGKG
jgi:site-specific DNA-methyltransferase (adenine-specific)